MEEPINNLFNHVLNGNIKAYTNTLFFLNYFNINGIIGTLSHLNLVMFSLKVIHPLIKTSNSNLGVEKKKTHQLYAKNKKFAPCGGPSMDNEKIWVKSIMIILGQVEICFLCLKMLKIITTYYDNDVEIKKKNPCLFNYLIGDRLKFGLKYKKHHEVSCFFFFFLKETTISYFILCNPHEIYIYKSTNELISKRNKYPITQLLIECIWKY